MPELENDSPDQQNIDPRKLRRAISDHFDLNGFRELCFEIQFDFDNLNEGGKDTKVLHLVQIYEDMNRLYYLASVFVELRPAIAIQDLLYTEDDPPPPTVSTTTTVPTNTESRGDTLIVGKSFTSLIRLLSKPEVRTAVVSFQTDFAALLFE